MNKASVTPNYPGCCGTICARLTMQKYVQHAAWMNDNKVHVEFCDMSHNVVCFVLPSYCTTAANLLRNTFVRCIVMYNEYVLYSLPAPHTLFRSFGRPARYQVQIMGDPALGRIGPSSSLAIIYVWICWPCRLRCREVRFRPEFWDKTALAGDEVHHCVWCLLDMPQLCLSPPTLLEEASAVPASSPDTGYCFHFLVEITVMIPYIYLHL